MYHYVRRYDPRFPFFRFLDFGNFCKQLDYFENAFGFLELSEWQRCLESKSTDNCNGKVVLTFDDAMRCHYDFVFPELRRRGLWGIFYVPTAPYVTNEILDVHRIHLLCGAFSGVKLMHAAEHVLDKDMISAARRDEFENLTYRNQNNDEGVTEFKRLLNYFIDPKYKATAITEVAAQLKFNFLVDEFYIPTEGLVELYEGGNVIGSHTHTHPVMSQLSYSEQKTEISSSFKILDDLGCIAHKTYCHPYGGAHCFNTDTVDILNEVGVLYSFSLQSRGIESEDLRDKRQALPRYDCNEFYYGAAS